MLSTLTNSDIAEAMSLDVGEAASALEKADEIDTMSKEQMAPILRKLIDRASSAQTMMSRAATPRQSRATSEERKSRRKTPTEMRQERCAAEIRYQEKDMCVTDWNTAKPEAINPGLVLKEPYRSPFVQLVDDMKALDLSGDWEERYDASDEGDQILHFTPLIEPAFLAQYWEINASMQFEDPFHIKMNFPAGIGHGLGVQPHLVFKPMTMLGDKSKQFPKQADVIPVRLGELDLSRRLAAATASINNIVAVANRELSLKVEDLATPLPPKREHERLLTSVIREGVSVINQLTSRMHVLQVSLIKRDAMLRGGVDPQSNINLFASPWTGNVNYKPSIDQNKYEQWVDQTGADARTRQTQLRKRWHTVKTRRDAWWHDQQKKTIGHQQAYMPPLEPVGTPVVAEANVDDAARGLTQLDKLPDLV